MALLGHRRGSSPSSQYNRTPCLPVFDTHFLIAVGVYQLEFEL